MKAKGGVIDLHTHGAGRFDTRAAGAGGILDLALLHGRAGVAAILPTVYSAPIDTMRGHMEAVREAMQAAPRKGAARILGVHLEGPFLNPLRSGALEGGSFLAPTLSSLRKLIAGFEHVARVITVAPEARGALRVIGRCAELGIRVNMGHSDATYQQALEGKRAGASGVTHLFNAMRPFHHREPGLAGLGLLDEDLYVEVIPDGVHLGSGALRLVFSVKRKDRILLVSDSVKGPMRKGGVLRGAKALLPEGMDRLRGLGVPEKWITKAAVDNPRRYIRK
jgi:N-acetylglucosamine-6-phosphate deacetylase